MEEHIKVAFEAGVLQALDDYGVSKEAVAGKITGQGLRRFGKIVDDPVLGPIAPRGLAIPGHMSEYTELLRLGRNADAARYLQRINPPSRAMTSAESAADLVRRGKLDPNDVLAPGWHPSLLG